MKTIVVGLAIVASSGSLDENGFDTKRFGSEVSDLTGLRVNNTRDDQIDYTIIFRDNVFARVNPDKLSDAIINLLEQHLPGNEFMFGVMLRGDISEVSLTKANRLAAILCSEDDDDDDELDDEISEMLRNVGYYGRDDYDDEDDDDYPHMPKDLLNYLMNNNAPTAYHSMSWHNSNNAKKMIRRHGVIVASKKDISKDERIIKDFLKVFFPGNASWKKEFRADVAKRWVQMFVVTKGQLKRLEKADRKHRRAKDNDERVDKTISFANMLFGSRDHWSDPNR